MLIYIIRHGETDGNTQGYFQGWTNNPLNEKGRALAIQTGRGLLGVRFDECISSPLDRARETAEILLRESGNAGVTVTVDERIKEVCLGDWERKKFRPAEREIDEEDLKRFFGNPFLLGGFPNGETVGEVCARTQSLLKELLRRDDGKTILLVTHGFAMRAMLNCLYEERERDDFWHGRVPPNCAVNIVEGVGGEGRLIAQDKVYHEERIHTGGRDENLL
ncbi:MAG: histidine phosphatase family protein [Clostridiales bacterium]|nr:histidine phosphatase family protein [Clostridiales bacterium]